MSRVSFTSDRVQKFTCPKGKDQAFLWDTRITELGLRVTPSGKPSYIFQGRFKGKTVRITIGKPDSWSIQDARAKAREYQRQIDEGHDPRIIKAENKQAATDKKTRLALESLTFGELWMEYVIAKKGCWAKSTYQDHLRVIHMGGKEYKRWAGKKTTAGVLAALMPLKVYELNQSVIEKLAQKECKVRPTNLRLGLRMLRAFLSWCHERKNLPVSADLARTKEIRRLAGTPQAKKDHLLKEQLSIWFDRIQNIPNPVISSYLQCLLLTGARRNELLQLKWTDIDSRWRTIKLHDKTEDFRHIPLTPYVENLLKNLPQINEWVFSSQRSKSGQLVEPSKCHLSACKSAGLSLTLHGLRRSFKSLSEWQELPIGVIAQIMGHKPSATAEKHYTIRPIDLLRMHHEKFESWIIEQAKAPIPLDSSLNAFKGLKNYA